MNFCTLNPPNTRTLSDKVIANVVPKPKILRHGTTSEKPWREDLTLGHSPHRPKTQSHQAASKKSVDLVIPESSEPYVEPNDTVDSVASVINLMGQTDLSTGRKRTSCLLADLHTAQRIMASIQETSHPITDELKHTIVAEALKRRIRHRERCRISQARYRNKQHKFETDIQATVSKLKREIEVLEAKCKDSFRFPETPTIWTIAAEYIRHFSYYVASPAMLQSTVSKYLHGIMAPDVIVGSKFGVEAQLENWKLFALYFDDIHLELRGMNMPTSDMLVAHTMINATLTSNTLRRVFPHLNSDGCGGTKGGSWSPLATKMLDQKVVMRGSVVFGWDNATDKIVRVQFQADLMTPMIQLLGNLRNVTCVFVKARVTPDCDFVRREDN